MNIEEQVLNISQVQELQELGFDIEKYSSMYFVPNWITKYGINEIQDYLLAIGGEIIAQKLNTYLKQLIKEEHEHEIKKH